MFTKQFLGMGYTGLIAFLSGGRGREGSGWEISTVIRITTDSSSILSIPVVLFCWCPKDEVCSKFSATLTKIGILPISRPVCEMPL